MGVVHLVDERSLVVGIQLTRLQLDELLAVVLGHLIVVGIGAGSLLVAAQILVSDSQVGITVHVEIVVGTLHGTVGSHSVTSTEQGDTGDKTNGKVAVHALDASGVHVAPLHVGLDVDQLLQATAVDNVLVGAGLVNLLTPNGCDVVVGNIAEEVAHQIVAESLQAGGLTLDLLHLVLTADAAGIDAGTHLVGTLNGLQVVVPDFLHVAPSNIVGTLQGPDGITVVGGCRSTNAHGLYVGVLCPHTAHTRGVGVFAEQYIYAVDGVCRKLGRAVNLCHVAL